MPAPSPSSWIDRVDTADRRVGRIRRREVFSQRAGFRVVHVFLFEKGGRLLLQQLSPQRERHPLRWGSSVAGYLHAGEAVQHGAKRRLREELAIELPLHKYGSLRVADHGATKFVTLFTATGGLPRIAEPQHIRDLRWWSLSDLDDRVENKPESFTPTFRQVYGFYRRTHDLTLVE